MGARVSLAELASDGFVLNSREASAIVLEVCRQYSHGVVRGIPSAHVIRLTPDGNVVAEGPITTDHPPIAKAAQLLEDLLPPFGAPPAYRVPGGLRLVVARGLGTLDLPPFESLDDFCAAVARFATDDLTSAARNVYKAWESTRAPRALTISDLRRARRATGLSLENISSVCGVSSSLLRELEWGYLKNWRNDSVGRTWLAGYAKASGLDEQLVTSIVAPMLAEADPRRDFHGELALVASGPQALIPSGVGPAVPVRSQRARPLLSAFAAAVGIAVLGFIATPDRPRTPIPTQNGSQREFVPEFVTSDAPLARTNLPVRGHVVYAVQTRTAAPSRASKGRPTVKRAKAAASRGKPAKPDFFKRQLLRIILK